MSLLPIDQQPQAVQESILRIREDMILLIQQAIDGVQSSVSGSMPSVNAFVNTAGESVTFGRRGPITFVYLDTQNGTAPTGTVKTITAQGTTEGDIIIFKLVSGGRVVTFDFANGVNIIGLSDATYQMKADGYAAFINVGGDFVQMPSNQLAQMAVDSMSYNASDIITISSAGAIDTGGKSYVRVQSERSAETPAEWELQWNTIPAGTFDADVTVDKLDGNGAVSIFFQTYPPATTIATVIADVTASIGGGFTAVDDAIDTNTLTAPAGNGAAANSWAITTSVVAGLSTTTTATVAGVNGTDQNDSLITINGTLAGQLIVIENVMPSNTITLGTGGNLTGDVPTKIFAGGLASVFSNSAYAIAVLRCCYRETTATRWVDPAGLTVGLKNILYPYQTIVGAKTAAAIGDAIRILSSSYDERSLLPISSAISYIVAPNTLIDYSGVTAGALFDDSPTGTNTPVSFSLFCEQPNQYFDFANAQTTLSSSGNSDRVIYSTTSNLLFNGGYYYGSGVVETIKIEGGITVMENCHIDGSGSRAIIVSGGLLRLKNCYITNAGAVETIQRTAGDIIIEDCIVKNTLNNASGHAIKDTAAATTGKIVFIGTNRLIVSNAAANSINCTNAQNYKKMGEVYSNYGFGGTTPTDLITGAAMTMVTDTDVE